MADTQVLRQKLEAQLRDIQEKLRAVALVEAMSAEISGNGAMPPRRTMTQTASGKTIKETVRLIALANPTQEWTALTMTPEVERQGRKDATRANVTTALRRLAKAGALDLISKSKREGFAYKAKTHRTPVQ